MKPLLMFSARIWFLSAVSEVRHLSAFRMNLSTRICDVYRVLQARSEECLLLLNTRALPPVHKSREQTLLRSPRLNLGNGHARSEAPRLRLLVEHGPRGGGERNPDVGAGAVLPRHFPQPILEKR